MNTATHPLERHCRLATRHADELEHFLAAKDLGVELPASDTRTAPLDAVINAYYMPNSYISYLHYQAPVTLIAQGTRSDFTLSLPSHGSFDACIGTERIRGGGRVGTLGSPSLDQRTSLDERSGRYGISISQGALVRQLECLLDAPLTEPVRFAPRIELDGTAGRSLTSLIRLAVDELNREDSGFENPLVAAQFEQLLITTLLSHQPHNYLQCLSRPAPRPAPSDLRRALDYIHDNLDRSITLTELVEVAGVAGRSLHDHFRRFTGKSPLAYVTEQRLACARKDLVGAGPEVTVTSVASRWGFTQLGRFSGLYRKTYGELPSETLRSVRLQ